MTCTVNPQIPGSSPGREPTNTRVSAKSEICHKSPRLRCGSRFSQFGVRGSYYDSAMPKDIPLIPTEIVLRELSKLDGAIRLIPVQVSMVLGLSKGELDEYLSDTVKNNICFQLHTIEYLIKYSAGVDNIAAFRHKHIGKVTVEKFRLPEPSR